MNDQFISAVVSEAVSVATSFLTDKCSKYNSINEKIDRLESLRIKIKAAVDVSEAFVNIEPLREWQEKLKKALSEADEMLGIFKARILLEKPNQTFEAGSSSHDQTMQEEGSDHPSSNLREAITHQVKLEPNLPDDQPKQEEGSDDATLVHPASNLWETVTHQVNLEANLPRDQSMQQKVSDDVTLVYPASNLREAAIPQVNLEEKLLLATTLKQLFCHVLGLVNHTTDSPWPGIKEGLSVFARVLDPRNFSLLNPRMMVDKYLEKCEDARKLIKTMEKLEKMSGDIGDFLKLLKLQSKHCKRKRKSKRSARCRCLVTESIVRSKRKEKTERNCLLTAKLFMNNITDSTSSFPTFMKNNRFLVYFRSMLEVIHEQHHPKLSSGHFPDDNFMENTSFLDDNFGSMPAFTESRDFLRTNSGSKPIYEWESNENAYQITKKSFFVIFSLKSHINVYYCYGEDQSTISEDHAVKLWIFEAISLCKAMSSLCSIMDIDPLALFSSVRYVEINIFIVMFNLN